MKKKKTVKRPAAKSTRLSKILRVLRKDRARRKKLNG